MCVRCVLVKFCKNEWTAEKKMDRDCNFVSRQRETILLGFSLLVNKQLEKKKRIFLSNSFFFVNKKKLSFVRGEVRCDGNGTKMCVKTENLTEKDNSNNNNVMNFF